jgi:Right handed beta helix region
MRTITLLLAAMVISLGLGLQPAAAQAPQPAKQTWVSSTGNDDTNTCTTPASPCQTFTGAYGKTAPGGEINCVDSGPFEGAQISMSLTISCTGVEAGVQFSAGNGFFVTAASTDVVVIEGLDIEGTGGNSEPPQDSIGIDIISAGSVTVRNCRIAGFSTNGTHIIGSGIVVVNNDNMKLLVVDSVIENSAGAGIYLQPQGSANLQATIN